MSCIDPEELIAEVRSRRILYAKDLPEYLNNKKKKNAWKDITKTLSDDWATLTNEEKNNRCKDIQGKWKSIRDNFRRDYQIQNDAKSEQGIKNKRKRLYRYYDKLLFLVPYVRGTKHSEKFCNSKNTSALIDPNSDEKFCNSKNTSALIHPNSDEKFCNSKNTSALIDLNSDESSESIPNIEKSPTWPSSSQTPKKKKFSPSFEEAILKALNDETDEDKTFCLSIVQSLKKMDDDNKITAKIEILKVVHLFSKRSRNECN